MTVGQLLARAAQTSAGTASDPAELRLLLAELLACQPLELSLYQDRELSPELADRFGTYHSRLLKNEPPQYILGRAWFYGLELEVSPAVLIPRPETEGLAELALAWLKPGMQVLEIGTGSGAIAIALKHEQPGLNVTATDISSGALDLARQNALRHHCQIDFIQADLFPPDTAPFDLIISNPPYISSSEYSQLAPRIRDHEPRLALLAEDCGLEFYRRILAQAALHLSPGGQLILEHGCEQRKSILSLADQYGFHSILAREDLAGRDRYLGLKLNKG